VCVEGDTVCTVLRCLWYPVSATQCRQWRVFPGCRSSSCLDTCTSTCSRCLLCLLVSVSCSGRNLTWQTNMGTVDLKGMFDKRYEFSVRFRYCHPY
jgi:hypothetical protein